MVNPLRAIRHINLSYVDFLVSVILILLSFLLPLFDIAGVSSLVTPAASVFAIVAGFFIADATGNYLRLQTLIAEENATLISITHTARNADPHLAEGVRKTVDAYMVAQLDIDELDHAIETKDEFEALIASLDNLIISGKVLPRELISSLGEEKDRLIVLNQEMTLTAHSNLTLIHWSILAVLAVVVSITVLALRDGTFLMNLITVGMLLGSYGVLVVLRDVDNNRYLQRKLAFRNPQQVFEAVGLPPYYPQSSPEHLRNPDVNGKYRTRDRSDSIVEVSKTSTR